MLQNKNVVTVVLLSIVTCGIYNLVWVWQTSDALHQQGKNSIVEPIVQFVLYLLTAQIGWIIFSISADNNLNAIRAQRGLPAKDNKILYIILAIVFPIAVTALVQNEINELA